LGSLRDWKRQEAYAQPKFPLRVCIAAGFASFTVASAIKVIH
jgi:hypothetical protein